MLQAFFDLFKLILLWLTNPALTQLQLFFLICFVFFLVQKWFKVL